MTLKLENIKFTVIIPTLWRSDLTLDLLSKYDNCISVDEILIIDNAIVARPQFDFSIYKKIRFIDQKENIYVNPAWNIGIKEAKNELIAISNDDILFNPEPVFKFVSEAEDWGAIGMSALNYNIPAPKIVTEPGADIGGGWGCLLFVRKSEWIPIPENIKIWFGDDWIVSMCRKYKRKVLKIRTSEVVKTKMSTSSNIPSLHPVIQNDRIAWSKLAK